MFDIRLKLFLTECLERKHRNRDLWIMDTNFDLLAELHFLKTENGGRKTPAKTGFRPQLKFAFSEKSTSGKQNFTDKEFVFPGETAVAEIALLSPQFFSGMLAVGMIFEIREASQIIGSGKILEIKNETLVTLDL